MSKVKSVRFFVYIAASTLLLSNVVTAQTTSQHPVPLNHLYWHFLLLQNHLDRVAAAQEQQGQDGSALRNYYKQRVGLTDSQFAVVREAGLQLEPELKAIAAEVKAVIDTDRARHPKVLASPQDLPPVPPELAVFQQKHEAAIESAVNKLKAALGTQGTVKLETFLTQEFAHNVTAHSVELPHPHNDPTRHTVPAFPQQPEAQQ